MEKGFVRNDGGRADAGFKGHAGDCVTRAIAIAAGLPYRDVYDRLSDGMRAQRRTKGARRSASARDGVNTKRKWFKDYMAELGAIWTPTMQIGSGCTVHLSADELPAGRLVVAVSRHYTTMIDGVIHDTHDPRREVHYVEPNNRPLRDGEWLNENGICGISRRCVYGYWTMPDPQQHETP